MSKGLSNKQKKISVSYTLKSKLITFLLDVGVFLVVSLSYLTDSITVLKKKNNWDTHPEVMHFMRVKF